MNRLANGNLLSVLATLQNGDQESITTSTLLNNDPIVTATRPDGLGRDTVRTGNIYQIDTRYTRTLFTLWERLNTKFIFEGLNIFNTRNVTSTNVTATVNSLGAITTPPSLGPVSTVLEGRLLQIGIRADW